MKPRPFRIPDAKPVTSLEEREPELKWLHEPAVVWANERRKKKWKERLIMVLISITVSLIINYIN